MKDMNVHFSSRDSDRLTPKWLLEHLYEVFEFALDPAAEVPSGEDYEYNVQAKTHFSPFDGFDGLDGPWWGVVYCNPPYGSQVGKWVAKGRSEVERGSAETVVFLLPARTDTRWWQDNADACTLCTFIRGRLTFHSSAHGEEENTAPFPSAIMVFGRITKEQVEHLARLGWTTAKLVEQEESDE